MDDDRFGPYVVEELLGAGGMGTVHRALDTRKNRRVALKRLPMELAGDPQFVERFRREAELTAQLNDPHVVPIHDYGEIDGQLFLDMRLVTGVDLAAVLNRRGPFSAARAVEIIGQVARALDAAHREQLVHRDVKPSNILLAGDTGANGETESADEAPPFTYLIDFGIAANAHATRLTSTRATIGTAAYMAPERFTGVAGAGNGVDVYSLGAVLFELLCGWPPFRGDFPRLMYAHLNEPPPSPSFHRPGLPVGLDEVVALAMAKQPDQRYRRAGDLAAAARAVLGSARPDAPRPATLPPWDSARPPTGPPPGGGTPQSGRPTWVPNGTGGARSPEPVADGQEDRVDPGAVRGRRRGRLVPLLAALGLVVVLVVVSAVVLLTSRSDPTTTAPPPVAADTADVAPEDAAITAEAGEFALPPGRPGVGKPPVVVGSKDFSEQTLLNEVYTQSFRAKGYTVEQRPGIGSTEVMDAAFAADQITFYPEYLGVLANGPAGQPTSPPNARLTYDAVGRFVEDQRRGRLFLQTPFQDVDLIVVKREYAQRFGLETIGDLNKVAPGGQGIRVAAQPSFRTREAGLVGMARAYGLTALDPSFVSIRAGSQVYEALDSGQADAGDAFSTDSQLLSGDYTELEDPAGVFGSQHVAPVIKQATANAQGPEFEQTANWVSGLLSTRAVREMNQAVAGGQEPADVARAFLLRSGLV